MESTAASWLIRLCIWTLDFEIVIEKSESGVKSLGSQSGVWSLFQSLESGVWFRVRSLESDSESGVWSRVWSLIQSWAMQIVVNSKIFQFELGGGPFRTSSGPGGFRCSLI